MKPTKLTNEEKAFVDDKGDLVILEIIKGMSLEELRSFDIYTPKNMKHYSSLQVNWLKTEEHLIKNRQDHVGEVSELELIEDICKHHNGERYKVFYVLKYPDRVQRINEES
jgi:hypothetical protein